MVSFTTFLKQHSNTFIASLALIVALLLLLSVRPAHNSRDVVREALFDTVGPVLRILQAPVTAYRTLYSRIHELQRLDKENRQLRVEIARLRPLNIHIEELALENKRLRLLLGMRPNPSYRELVARVTGDSSSAFARSFILDAGRIHGVVNGAPVLATGGVLGHIVQVSKHTSLALIVSDLNSRVPALIQRNRIRSIVSGYNQPTLIMKFVPKGSDVLPGDRVLTSGVGGVYPKGLSVGWIKSISSEKAGLFHTITVQPSVDFDRTEEVRLLLPIEPHTPIKRSDLTPPKDSP